MAELGRRAAGLRPRLARAMCLAIALASFARAHLPSRDNILRVQLWDAEGLSEDSRPSPLDTLLDTNAVTPRHMANSSTSKRRTSLHELTAEMFSSSYDGFSLDSGRFTRHKVRHKRRRARDERGRTSGEDASESESEGLAWTFHGEGSPFNVIAYDSVEGLPDDGSKQDNNDEELILIAAGGSGGAKAHRVDISPEGSDSAVSSVWSASLSGVNGSDASAPMTLRQDIDDIQSPEESEKKQVAVVPKCCPSGQNLSYYLVEGKRVCQPSVLTFQPVFYEYNDTFMWEYESNLFETIVGNPCTSDRYKLDPETDSSDEFYLTVNGSIFAPYHKPPFLTSKEFCMETFWNESNPAGITLPLICFSPAAETKPSATLIAYALGLILSVPFLVATVCSYTLVPELRDTHGLSLACHSACLAIAFSCLAATQLAGHAFPDKVCSAMAFVIQFSFVSCFFWLNVMCFDTWLNVRHHLTHQSSRHSEKRRFLFYCAYAVLLPLALLVVTLVMDLYPAVPSTYLKPNFGAKGCWFKTEQAALPYFYGPVACILLANLLIFFLTSRAFAQQYDKLNNLTVTELTHPEFRTSDDWLRLSEALDASLQSRGESSPATPHRERHVNFKYRWKKYRKIFRMCLMLSCIMGLSWVMEVVSWAAGAGGGAVSVWSVFDIINALQGLVIFAIFVLQKPIRGLVWRRLSVKCAKLCGNTRSNESELEVVSERTIIDCENSGKRVYV